MFVQVLRDGHPPWMTLSLTVGKLALLCKTALRRWEPGCPRKSCCESLGCWKSYTFHPPVGVARRIAAEGDIYQHRAAGRVVESAAVIVRRIAAEGDVR